MSPSNSTRILALLLLTCNGGQTQTAAARKPVDIDAFLARPPALHPDVLPGISLRFYLGRDGLEYDWILAPRADPSAICLGFTDASLSMTVAGDLIVQRSTHLALHSKPVAYQKADEQLIPIEVSFAISPDGTVGFALGAYDETRELVIDPVVRYSVSLGGTGGPVRDWLTAVGVDAHGFTYVVGYTSSPDFPTTEGAFQRTRRGEIDAFVAKVNKEGTGSLLLYGTFIGGGGGLEQPQFAAVAAGKVYIAGYSLGNTERNSIPLVNPIQSGRGERYNSSPTVAGCPTEGAGPPFCTDGFITAFNTEDMQLVFSSYLGGNAYDMIAGLAVDEHGDAVLAGNSTPSTVSAGLSPAWPLPGSKSQSNFITRIGMEGATPLTRRDLIRIPFSLAGTQLAPGMLVTLLGENITADEGAVIAPIPLPTELDGISVELGTQLAAMHSVSRVDGVEQITFLIPWDVAPTVPGSNSFHIAVNNNGSRSLPMFAEMATPHGSLPGIVPSLLRRSDGGVAAFHSDTTEPVTPENPGRRGEVVTLHAIGMGPVDPPVPLGEAGQTDPPNRVIYLPEVFFGDVQGELLTAQLAPGLAGIYQVDARIPSEAPGGTVAVRLQYPGLPASANIEIEK